MERNRNNSLKRKYTIAIISILALLTLLTIAYIKTDIFKTKEQLFWKYMGKKVDEIAQIISNDEIKAYNDSLKKSYYTKKSKISISSKHGFIKPINIEINKKGNNAEDIQNTNIGIEYNNEHISDCFIIKDKNYFILKSDYIGQNYIGIENKNLKQLVEKLGMQNTEFIPDELKEIDYAELFSITEDMKKHLSKKYVPIFRRIIRNKNYSKIINESVSNDAEKNDITSYKVEISEKEAKEIIIEMLKELYNDDISLNFISRKIELVSNNSYYTNINNIKEVIEQIIKYFESKEVSESEFLSIIIYRKEKKVEKIELMLKNNRTISIQTDNNRNKITITQSNVQNKTMNFESITTTALTILDSVTEIAYAKDISNRNENKVDINIVCDFGIEKINIVYNYVEQIKNNVEDILDINDVEFIDIQNQGDEFYKSLREKVP